MARRSARRYDYDPTYMLRGLKELHVEFDRADVSTMHAGAGPHGPSHRS